LPLHKIETDTGNIEMSNGIMTMITNIDYDPINTFLYPQVHPSIHPSIHQSKTFEENLCK